MEKTEPTVFEVNFRHGSICLRSGYCEAYMTLPDILIPLLPFRQTMVHFENGSIACREKWSPPRGMKREEYSIALHPGQSWMGLDLSSVLEAVRTCEEVSTSLPATGFRRRFC